jgi:hypothetical protein
MVACKNVYMVTEQEHVPKKAGLHVHNCKKFTYNTGCCAAMTLYLILGRQISMD